MIEVGKYYVIEYDSGEKFLVYIRSADSEQIEVGVCAGYWFYSLSPYQYSTFISHKYKTFNKYEPTRLEKLFGLVRAKKLFGEFNE